MHALAAALLAGSALAQSPPQQPVVVNGAPATVRVWYAPYGSVQTNANGQWSVTVPAGTFLTAIVSVDANPVSSDNTAPNAAYASKTTPVQSGDAWTIGGLVLLPSTVQALGALSAKAAGQGTVVMVMVVGY